VSKYCALRIKQGNNNNNTDFEMIEDLNLDDYGVTNSDNLLNIDEYNKFD